MSLKLNQNDITTFFETIKQQYKFSYDKLKKEQIQIIQHIVNGQNVLGMLPTGFGKTDTMLLPALIKDIVSITLFTINLDKLCICISISLHFIFKMCFGI